jgi:tripartite-type tricarboxylate transporter receptor subunit TctC
MEEFIMAALPSRFTRRNILAGAAALGALSIVPKSAAAAFPEQLIKIVVPFAAGGNQDIVARALAEQMTRILGKTVMVENRAGNSGIVGTRFVATSPPDGYTLVVVSNSFSRVPAIVPTAGYDPIKDFAQVTVTSRIAEMLVVNPGSGLNSVKDVIARAKAKPGEMSFASSGQGSIGHVAAEMFMSLAGIKLLHIPYKGNSQAIIDVIGGRVDMMFDHVSTSGPNVVGGKLKALAVTTRTRSPVFPDLPTMEEAGVPGYEDVTYNGLAAPAGTPREAVAALHAAVAKAVAEPELKKQFADRGIELVASASPEEFAGFVKKDVEGFATLARAANIKAD